MAYAPGVARRVASRLGSLMQPANAARTHEHTANEWARKREGHARALLLALRSVCVCVWRAGGGVCSRAYPRVTFRVEKGAVRVRRRVNVSDQARHLAVAQHISHLRAGI